MSHDRAIRAFIEQAQKNLDEKKYALAGEMLAKAHALDTRDADLTIRRAELSISSPSSRPVARHAMR